MKAWDTARATARARVLALAAVAVARLSRRKLRRSRRSRLPATARRAPGDRWPWMGTRRSPRWDKAGRTGATGRAKGIVRMAPGRAKLRWIAQPALPAAGTRAASLWTLPRARLGRAAARGRVLHSPGSLLFPRQGQEVIRGLPDRILAECSARPCPPRPREELQCLACLACLAWLWPCHTRCRCPTATASPRLTPGIPCRWRTQFRTTSCPPPPLFRQVLVPQYHHQVPQLHQ
mmetsp:Transcript_24165/g.52739  ORF Transcript_24165/g.52739 Transcript_24165/m.52739 type:complete len:234 (+) Transcript_24165:302-1003(+)